MAGALHAHRRAGAMAPATAAVKVPPPVREEPGNAAFPPPARDGAPQTGRSGHNSGQRRARRGRSARHGRGGRWPGALAPGWSRISVALRQGRWPLPGCTRRPQAEEVPALRSGSRCGWHVFSILAVVPDCRHRFGIRTCRLPGSHSRRIPPGVEKFACSAFSGPCTITTRVSCSRPASALRRAAACGWTMSSRSSRTPASGRRCTG